MKKCEAEEKNGTTENRSPRYDVAISPIYRINLCLQSVSYFVLFFCAAAFLKHLISFYHVDVYLLC